MARKLLIGVLVLVNCILLYSVVFSGKGVLSLRAMREDREKLVARAALLGERSERLSQEIIWLEKGGEYTERIIRDKANFLKDDEIVYIIEGGAKETVSRERQVRGAGDQ